MVIWPSLCSLLESSPGLSGGGVKQAIIVKREYSSTPELEVYISNQPPHPPSRRS